MNQVPHITVQGRAVVTATPDQVTLSFSILESTPAYGPTLQGLANRVHHLRADLQIAGLEVSDLRTGHFSIQPAYDYHEGKQTFRGYEARQNLSIQLPADKDLLSKVLGLLSRSESQAEFQLQFGLAHPSSQQEEALRKAVVQARKDAAILAAAGGVSLGELMNITYGEEPVHPGGGLQVRMSAMKEDAPLDVDPAEVSVEARVTATWAIRSN